MVKQTLARIPLRDYQKNAVRFFCAGIGDRDKVKVVELPTGTGKTRVGVAVAACLMMAGYTVLWACKSRRLLRQAADEFAHHFPECRSRVRWLGRTRRPQPLVRGGLVFTTLQTWHRRRHRLPGVISPAANLAVIWDEVHWAFGQSIGRFFREAYQGRVPVLGLTATPPHSTRAEMIYRRTPEEFFGTVLALPEFKQIATGVDWTPDVRHEEFTPSSLRRLAEDARRNAVVVESVVGLLTGGRARSILVFAANIPHAQELARRLSVSGVPARVIHSQMPAREQEEAERLFRAGAVNVLVNVDQLTEGFDHPPVDAVLLTRPTRGGSRWSAGVPGWPRARTLSSWWTSRTISPASAEVWCGPLMYFRCTPARRSPARTARRSATSSRATSRSSSATRSRSLAPSRSPWGRRSGWRSS